MLYEILPKSQKKIARKIIDKGLQKDYANGLLKVKTLLNNWSTELPDHREIYMKVYKTVKDHDKGIARKFNNVTGSKYVFTIVILLLEGLISEEDLDEFSPPIKEKIMLSERRLRQIDDD